MPARRVEGVTVGTLLVSRLALFAVVQSLLAFLLGLTGTSDAWATAAGWWPLVAAATNVVSIGLLRWAAARDGLRLRDVFNLGQQSRGDVLPLLIVMAAAAVLGALPSPVLGNLLFGDVSRATELMFRPIPYWAAVVGLVAFPLTIAFAELPTYFGYIMPRLEQRLRSRTRAVVVASALLSLQHVTLPLILDARFMTWRALMFLPFALVLGTAIRLRPGLLPYLMFAHALIDVAAASQVLAVAVR
jgi:hypothetical protein